MRSDVGNYIANSVKEARPTLREIRKIIKSTVPQVEEGISYGVPFYKYHGEFVGFATYKHHVNFGFGPGVLQSGDRKKLEESGCTILKGTMHIKFDQKVPTMVIKKILRTKAKMNREKQKVRLKP